MASIPVMYIQRSDKMGYLKMMDQKLNSKNWNRRWMVLKGSELKYYKPNKKTMKGVINLDTWCKLSKCSTPDTFQLATQKKVYHWVSKSEQECDAWIRGQGSRMYS